MGLNRCNFIGVLICWCLLFHGPLSSVGGAMGNTIGLYHGLFLGGGGCSRDSGYQVYGGGYRKWQSPQPLLVGPLYVF